MKMKMLAILAATQISGCATMVLGTSQEVSFSSEPPGAEVIIDGKAMGKTPTILTLSKKHGYDVRFELEGFKDYKATIDKVPSNWIWSSVGMGGVIGTAIDDKTGGAYRLMPEKIEAELEKR